VLGYSLHHLKTNDRIERLGNDLFPTDSTLKVAIMAAAMEHVVSDKIGYGSTRQIISGDRNAGGFFYSFRENTILEFREVVHQMITHSDNTATLMLMRWIGGADPVNEWLRQHDLIKTRLVVQYPVSKELESNTAKIEELQRDIAKWGMGVSTPNEMGRLMEMIVDGRAGSPAAVVRACTSSRSTPRPVLTRKLLGTRMSPHPYAASLRRCGNTITRVISGHPPLRRRSSGKSGNAFIASTVGIEHVVPACVGWQTWSSRLLTTPTTKRKLFFSPGRSVGRTGLRFQRTVQSFRSRWPLCTSAYTHSRTPDSCTTPYRRGSYSRTLLGKARMLRCRFRRTGGRQ
jgi:hypothetical protein